MRKTKPTIVQEVLADLAFLILGLAVFSFLKITPHSTNMLSFVGIAVVVAVYAIYRVIVYSSRN